MNLLVSPVSSATMSSREIAELCEARHNDVIATIERLVAEGVIRLDRNTSRQYIPDGGGRPTQVYDLDKRDSLIVASGYNAKLRARIIDRWIELEASAPPTRALSPAEMFLQNAQAMVDIERRQAQNEQAVAQIASRVEQVEQRAVLTSRPANAESIVHLRPRAARQFGIPEWVVEHIIRQSPYAPRPGGMVRNDKEQALGATYAIYWTKDVNDVLRRFCAECTMVSTAFATHPYIDGKFKMTKWPRQDIA